LAKKKIDITRLNDFDYYSHNLLYIQAGEGLIPFDYNNRFVQVQINKKWVSYENQGKPVRFIVLKARRHGVSTLIQAHMFHRCHTRSHRQAITMAADDEGASYIHDMSHIFYDYLPEPLKPQTRYRSRKSLTFDIPKSMASKKGVVGTMGLKSRMRTVPSHERAGLSTGSHYIHFSEYSHYRNAEDIRKAVIPTAFQVKDAFVIIESTANGMVGVGEAFYEEWSKAVRGDSTFTPLFFSWLDHEDYTEKFPSPDHKTKFIEKIQDDEMELIRDHNATYEQLYWRRNQIRFLGGRISDRGAALNDFEAFHEQYPTTPEEAFIVSGLPVFDRAVLRTMFINCKEHMWLGDIEGSRLLENSMGHLRIWEKPVKGAVYVISIDPSSGEPGATDYGCIQVLKVGAPSSGMVANQVAEWHGKMSPEVLGQYGVMLAKLYNNGLFCPEMCGYGHATLVEAQRLDYWNIYKRRTLDTVRQTSTTKLGWSTTVATKPVLLSFGRLCINGRLVKINSKELLKEMMIFVRDEGSGAAAYGSGKDDRVMSYLIGLKIINLEYGIDDLSNTGISDPPKFERRIKDNLKYDDESDLKSITQKKGWLDD